MVEFGGAVDNCGAIELTGGGIGSKGGAVGRGEATVYT